MDVSCRRAQHSAHNTPCLRLPSNSLLPPRARITHAAITVLQGLDPSKVYRHHVAISHTRWATHGPPSAVNSHPHVSDPCGDFVVVHNGIITNYQALKDILVRA